MYAHYIMFIDPTSLLATGSIIIVSILVVADKVQERDGSNGGSHKPIST